MPLSWILEVLDILCCTYMYHIGLYRNVKCVQKYISSSHMTSSVYIRIAVLYFQFQVKIKIIQRMFIGEEKWSITDWHLEWVVTNCDINFAKVHFFLGGFPLDESVLSSDTNDHHHTCRYWQISIAHCSVYHELYHTSSEMINNIHYIIYN